MVNWVAAEDVLWDRFRLSAVLDSASVISTFGDTSGSFSLDMILITRKWSKKLMVDLYPRLESLSHANHAKRI